MVCLRAYVLQEKIARVNMLSATAIEVAKDGR